MLFGNDALFDSGALPRQCHMLISNGIHMMNDKVILFIPLQLHLAGASSFHKMAAGHVACHFTDSGQIFRAFICAHPQFSKVICRQIKGVFSTPGRHQQGRVTNPIMIFSPGVRIYPAPDTDSIRLAAFARIRQC